MSIPNTVDMFSFCHTALIDYSCPGYEGSKQENIWIAALSVGVQGVDRAAVGHTLHPDPGADTMKSLRHKVTISLRSYSSGRDTHQDNLLCLSDPGVLHQVFQNCLDNVFPMECQVISEHTGVPGACVAVTAAVGDIG